MIVGIYIGEDKLDLFNDEAIEVNSSVQNINDITKNTTDFSKNFTVPASEINNRIFKHYYNQDIINGFDARTKVSGRIELSGLDYRYGQIALLSVKMKKNQPSSYSIVFYGNMISLVDKIGSDELSSLDLSAYDHPYNSIQVFTYFTGGYNDLIYSFITKKRYFYDSSVAITDGNLYYPSGGGLLWSDLRPSLKLIALIEAIETKYDIQFSRDFFGRTEFDKLYMWLNNSDVESIETTLQVDFTSVGTMPLSQIEVNLTDNFIKRIDSPLTFSNNFRFRLLVINLSSNTTSYTIIGKIDGEVNFEVVRVGETYVDIACDINQEITFFIKCNTGLTFETKIEYLYDSFLGQKLGGTLTNNSQNLGVQVNTNLLIPKLKTIDFLKGLFQMFKLVVIQDKEADPIYVNTLDAYYSAGKLYDVTKYISTTEHEVLRGKLLNEINYKYQDPTTILAKQFKLNNGIAYGDAQLILEDDFGKKLDGEAETITLPFEQVVYERLTDTNTNTQLEIQYGAIIDDKSEPTNIKPLIHYNYYALDIINFIRDDGSNVAVNVYLIPSHTIDLTANPEFSLVFDREFSTYTGVAIENTLYTNYHQTYISSIFNAKRRNFMFEAKLPQQIMLKLKLNDILKIQDNYYRINSFTYNLMNGKAKFDLFNAFDTTINGFNASRTTINTDYQAKIESIFITNFTNLIFDYSATWITNAYFVGNNVYFDIELNDTGIFRSDIVTITNQETFAEIQVTINQTPTIITADNNTITADNNIITADNG